MGRETTWGFAETTPRTQPPCRHIMGPEADEEPPCCRRLVVHAEKPHLGCGRPLESILRHLRLCRPVCCRWWRVFCVCPVVCRSCGCCVAASLVLSFPSFGLAGGLVGSAPGEELVAAGGAIWTDLQRGSSLVTRPEVACGVRDLRPAQVGGSCRCRSIGEAF